MERRIGERRRVSSTEAIRWRVADGTKKGPGRKKRLGSDGVLDNLSVSGAGFVALATSGLRVGMYLELQLGGCWGLVHLVRERPTASPDHLYYGVTFVTAEPLFMAQVDQRVGGPPPPRASAMRW
ncbi:MAG: hypothetical protein JWM05_822 [Acidimicrobiales bacterium]|nr:hypothetical protein [Acidimicrobiales bacterium]